MSEPKVIQIGNDPSPEWNWVREQLAAHYANAEVMEALKAEDDALDGVFLDLLTRWYEEARHTYGPDVDCCFEIGVDERVGTVRLRLEQAWKKGGIQVDVLLRNLLELGVQPEVIEQATQAATKKKEKGKLFPGFDKVLDSRDRGKPKPKLELVK